MALASAAPGGPSARRGAALLAAAALALASCATLFVRQGPALADEFIYLAGARQLAEKGTLEARYYDAQAILRQGHPHQDNHAPGYVLILGGLFKLVGPHFAAAIVLNVLAYAAGAWLLHALARELGRSPSEALTGSALYLLLPALLPYVYWTMAELVLVALFLSALLAAARFGRGASGAALAGLLWGVTFLVRESALFGLPAVLSLLRGRRAATACLAAALSFGVFVYAPLSAGRSEGASNFWTPSSGVEFGFESVQAARRGDLVAAARHAMARAAMNVRELRAQSVSQPEPWILAAFALLPLQALSRWRGLSAGERRFLGGLLIGWLGLVLVMFGVYVVVRFAGFRYMLFLIPPFLPLAVAGATAGWRRAAFPLLFAALSLPVNLGLTSVLNAFKVSRQRRQQSITSYVERYADTRGITRIALISGWQFGLEHFPVEVISSLPEAGGELRLLEQRIWFDYLVLPGNSPLGPEWDARARYRRLNADDPDAPLFVYRRLK